MNAARVWLNVAPVAKTTSSLKTGALIGFAARLGAEAAHANESDVQALALLHQPELRMLKEEFSLPGWEGTED